MQKILLAAIFLLAAAVLPAQTPTTASVFFEPDQYELSSEAQQTLDALALQLLTAPDYAVNIEAWTDDRGTQEYNLRLANNRANAVQQYLADKGLLLAKTSLRSWGEQNLDYDNSTEENRQMNRRVDVAITSIFFSDYSALQNRLVSNTGQVLTIQPDKPQTVTAANGTIVVVPSQAFVFEDGTSPEGPVELIVREAFSPSDFILHNLTTMSDGKILQTGGMVYIGAQADGRPLTLANGAAITVALPTGQVDPGMELFYAQQTADGNINWQPAGQKFRQTLEDPQVTLDIDPALSARIMAIKVPVYPQPPVPNFSGEMPPEPRKPIAPYKPRAPQKPDWNNVQRMFGAGTTEPLKKKDAKKADKYYREAMAKYERDSANYVVLINRYLQNEANYETAKVKYAADRRYWNEELNRRIKTIMEYEREEYLHQYSLALQTALKRVGKNIQRYANYSNLEYAVHNTAIEHYNMAQKALMLKQKRDRMSVSAMYDKYLGYEVVESAGFKNITYSIRQHAAPPDSYRTTVKMMEATGIRPISDSLKAEIRERRLLFAKTSDQADRAIRAYVADVTRLGWINCDKFYNDPAEKVQLVVNEPEEATMYVLCRDLNSILSFSRNEQGAYVANGLPKGRAVSIVSIKLKDGVPHFALHDTKVGQTEDLKMDYKSMTLRDLREELKRLNI